MKQRHVLLLIVALPLVVATSLVGGGATGPTAARATGLDFTPIQNRIVSGFASFELGDAVTAKNQAALKSSGSNFVPSKNDGCGDNFGDNIKVNQNCLNITDADLQGRGQAENETAIAQDPNNPDQLVGASNDYLRGDGTCGAHWSQGGNDWRDSTMPNGFVRGTPSFGAAREYFEASGDPSVAWDSKGNAYYLCQMFDRGTVATNNPDASSGIYVFRSTGNNGASWNFPGRAVVEQRTANVFVLLDKPYMTIDNKSGSPFQDRVYVTWTSFASDGSAYIFEAHSSDFGESWSSPVLVSQNSTLCPNTYGITNSNGNCNENQDSEPFVGPDGALYVVFNNFNNALGASQPCPPPPTGQTCADNRNTVLLAKSTDGGATFGPPVLVSDYYDLPDCATYQNGQDPGRACVPEKGSQTDSVFRATNYPVGSVDPNDKNHIVVTFGSYINKDSNESNGCVPDGFSRFGTNDYVGVKTPGACNNKIVLSVSSDGGATFTGTTTDVRSAPVVNQDRDQATTDQWWQWSALTQDGKLAVSYYDRQYGDDETTGSMDISLSGSRDWKKFRTKQVTTSSMPLPTQFPDAQGNGQFFGDYTGLSAVNNTAYPIWMDTRNPDLFLCPGGGAPTVCTGTAASGEQANDQNIYTAKVPVP